MREHVAGLDTAVRQIGQLAHAAADRIESGANAAGDELQATLRTTRERLDQVERDLRRALKTGAGTTQRYVQRHPWSALAMAAAAALAIGVLLAPRRS